MNKSKVILLFVALAMMGIGSIFLVRLKSNQKLGRPGIRTTPIPDSPRLAIYLPEKVLDYESAWIDAAALVTNGLPHDTSFGQRRYVAQDKFWLDLNVVLMGTDRTSMHKPQFCLVGTGWRLQKTECVTVPMDGAHPYDLPVIKITCEQELGDPPATERRLYRGIYVYWFVADQAISADPSGLQRLQSTIRTLVTRNELQRWAYITCFAICFPGQEDLVFERMMKFMAVAVPQFQLATGASQASQAPGAGRAAEALSQ